jgi:L-ascorbate metabolism protein UlaG (beta-lactamase superfamily)
MSRYLEGMMKRRQLMRYAGAGLVTAFGTAWLSGFEAIQAQTNDTLSIQWLGHTCFLFSGGGKRILVNPFRPIGCTAGYRAPKIETELVLISSQLLDEGAVDQLPGDPKLLFEPGVYNVQGTQFQGIRTDHDRFGGRRFGINIAWRWNHAGINILHLGGAAAPITVEQKILMGRPDVLFVPTGGGAKAYNPTEAKAAIATLNPKIVIPTHYRTQAAADTCDIVALDEFLKLMDGMPIRNIDTDTMTLSKRDLPDSGSTIKVLSYNF